MIYQYPGAALVLKIDAPEVEFTARTLGPEQALIASSSVPGRRIGPVYQHLASVDRPRQLMIEVVPQRAIDRSAIRLEMLRFATSDRHLTTQEQAYRLFSVGAATERSRDTASWAMKTHALRNAAQLFAGLGMEEMRLWAEYFAALLVLNRLDDPLSALELAESIQGHAARAGFPMLQLGTQVLAGEAHFQILSDQGELAGSAAFERAHLALAGIVPLAERLRLRSEHGRALYQDGRVYELQGSLEEAIGRYRQALDILGPVPDTELLDEVRATAAAAYETAGMASGAIAMLDEMADALPADDARAYELERASRLYEKGRLLNTLYGFDAAVPELALALDLQQTHGSVETWAATALELAWASYSLGFIDDSLQLLEDVLPKIPPQGNETLLARAYGSLANMYRRNGRSEQATWARGRQRDLAAPAGRAVVLLEAARDIRLAGGSVFPDAERLLLRARRAARAVNDAVALHRIELDLCLLELEKARAADCVQGEAVVAEAALIAAGVPRLAAEAGLLRARILSRSGRAAAALDRMEKLIDEVHWCQRVLPGVLGPWYAENGPEMVREYLALARESGAGSPSSAEQGVALLRALERVRSLESAGHSAARSAGLDPGNDETLRNALAARDAASPDDAAETAAQANARLSDARRAIPLVDRPLSTGELDRLVRTLEPSAALLAYYFGESEVLALLAAGGEVRVFRLDPGFAGRDGLLRLRAALSGPQSEAQVIELERLGRWLLAPLAGALPPDIYLLPTGPLQGLPFDALRLRDGHLAENHSLVNLAELRSLSRRLPRLPRDFRDRVFLAGHPQEQRDPFSFEVRVGPEIAEVTSQFVGPGLHVVQGVALRPHEFNDPRFAQAALIHLAVPGTLDLGFPERSRLLLAGGATLAPKEARSFSLTSRLLVLSGTAVAGHGRSAVAGYLPFASDFLAAGSDAVLVSYWSAGETAHAEFAAELYRRLRADEDIQIAVAGAKRARWREATETNFKSWAGFQLFIR